MFKKKIPWWLKIASKLILSRLPFRYQFWQFLGLFRHGKMDNPDYAVKVFQEHVFKFYAPSRLKNKVILEVGPGDSVATAVIAAAYGAKAILVDVGNFAKDRISFYQELSIKLRNEGLSAPDLTESESVTDVLKKSGALYLTDGTRSLESIDCETVDVVFSQAVLEHVRRREFLSFMKHCQRILKQSGGQSHRVDLKDHLGGALNNLRFSESIWESDFFSSSGFYTNRIQFRQMISEMESAGLEVKVCSVDKWDKLPTPKGKMAKPFNQFSDDDLNVSGFNVICKKKG